MHHSQLNRKYKLVPCQLISASKQFGHLNWKVPRKREQRFGGPRDNAQALRITPGCSLAEREGWRPETLVGALRAPGTMVLGGHPGAGLHETQGGLLLGRARHAPTPTPGARPGSLAGGACAEAACLPCSGWEGAEDRPGPGVRQRSARPVTL